MVLHHLVNIFAAVALNRVRQKSFFACYVSIMKGQRYSAITGETFRISTGLFIIYKIFLFIISADSATFTRRTHPIGFIRTISSKFVTPCTRGILDILFCHVIINVTFFHACHDIVLGDRLAAHHLVADVA